MKPWIHTPLAALVAAASLSAWAGPTETYRAVMDLQNSRNGAGLKPYLAHKDPQIRAAAAEAFGSLQDASALPDLQTLLKDPDGRVRVASAYAIGQTGDKVSAPLLMEAFGKERLATVRRALLEAIGKCATPEALAFLVNGGKTCADPVTQEGYARGVFRAMAWKSLASEEGTALAVACLQPQRPEAARLFAANYLARVKEVDLAPRFQELRKRILTERQPEVRLALIRALGKSKTADTVDFLIKLSEGKGDYRYAVSALYALGSQDWPGVRTALLAASQRSQPNIATVAADAAAALAEPGDVADLLQASDRAATWYARVTLLGAAFQKSTGEAKASNLARLKTLYASSRNRYEKAQALYLIGTDLAEAPFVAEEARKAAGTIVGTQGYTALVDQVDAVKTDPKLKALYVTILKQAVETLDCGILEVACQALRNPELGFKGAYENLDFMETAFKAMKLPQDLEGYNVLAETLTYFTGKDYPQIPETPIPIDWSQLGGLKPAPKAIIRTDKGQVELALWPQKSPASTANFIRLARSGFYNGLVFHRVVPNFVVQGGCQRGDGYGSPDYVIASEFGSYRYETGTIGMASSGKDTEGTQFFITHNPTPHLDGRYSIFGKVTRGMNVIATLEVGDTIQSVDIR